MPDFTAEREAMVEQQLRSRGIRDKAILEAFRQVPREAFVSPAYANLAYGDHPLPIEAGQTISQPYIVALMIEAAGVSGASCVLEVGAGSGYAAAAMSRIVAKVTAIERQAELAELARERLARLGYDNIEIIQGDGTKGWPAEAPYDAILAAASGIDIPPALVEQLQPGASLVMPVGADDSTQVLVKAVKEEDGSVRRSSLGAVRFVPLIGGDG